MAISKLNPQGWGYALPALSSHMKSKTRHFFRGGHGRCSRFLLSDGDGLEASDAVYVNDCKVCRRLRDRDIRHVQLLQKHLKKGQAA